jgi:phage repressor protein C with HTH and peptisase S24 domain
MDFFSDALNRLKHELRVSKDQEVAVALGMSRTAFSERKKRSSFPEREVLELGRTRPELDVKFVLTGVSSDQVERLNAKEKRIANAVDAGLDYAAVVADERSLEVDEKQRVKNLLMQYYAADKSTQKLMEQASTYVLVPRYDVRASAGAGSMIHDESIVDHLVFKRQWLTQSLGCAPEQVCVIQVRGDSMTPTINDTDLLLLDMRALTQRAEGVYVIQLQGSLLVKRLRFKLNGTVDVISDNKRYGTETLTSKEADQLTVLGRVVWHGCKF